MQRQQAFNDAYAQELKRIADTSRLRLQREYQENREHQSYDILVLSGGGALGAFGAGFLKGWGEVREKEYVRPTFDSVSGISTGALIAPFAFAGTEQAYNNIVSLYSNPDEDMIVSRSLLAFLTGNKAYYNASRLHDRIKSSINVDLVDAMVSGARDNRVLMVGATNLDYGIMRVWDLAKAATAQTYEQAHAEVTQKLIASSAIPGAFPSVIIDDYLYVDGGASLQMVSGIDDREWLYDPSSRPLPFVDEWQPLKIRIWVVINNKLLMEPDVTNSSWASIATRSLLSLMKSSTLQTIQDAETFAQLINRHPQFDVKMRYVSIPQEYVIPETENMFDRDKMRDLVQLGVEMGKDHESWKTRSLNPGAPVVRYNK